ncbi:hypothetical protein J3U17_11770, partial [Gilliamella sp. B2864]
LVGRDTNGTPVVKYGFTLKQWFVNRGSVEKNYPNTLSWCNSLGYQVPRVKDLTNANYYNLGATPSSPGNHFMRHIGSGFFTEWGYMKDYSGVGFNNRYGYWTSDPYFIVGHDFGVIAGTSSYEIWSTLCAHP